MTELQQNAISGKITDENGEPLPGVTVIIKGTTQGTVSDFEGNYSITNIPTGSILQFSFVGMKTQEFEIVNQSTFNVTMVADAIGLEEVVAIGYGTVRKSDLTGAVSSVSSDEIKKQPVTNLSQAIQGRTSGVVVSNNSGAPGGSVKIRIRGANSILGNNDPLYYC